MPTANFEVVIPAYDDGSHLSPLIGALNHQAQEAQVSLRVIVSDDGSPTALTELYDVAKYGALALSFVRGPNAGPGAARNRGVASCSADWVAFLDADTIPAEGWLDRLNRLLNDSPDADAFEGVTEYDEGKPSPFSHATEIRSETAHGGANIVYRRRVLAELGGFDEAFYDVARGLHFREDLDLYFRAVKSGYRVVPVNELVIRHPPLEASIKTPLRLARRYYYDPLLARKHPNEFRTLNRARMLGPVSLRLGRHVAAVGHVTSVMAGAGLWAVPTSRKYAKVSSVLIGGTLLTNLAALSWRRSVQFRDVAPLLGVSVVTPWIYSWNYYRGVLKFRHLPKLQ